MYEKRRTILVETGSTLDGLIRGIKKGMVYISGFNLKFCVALTSCSSSLRSFQKKN